MKYIPLSQGFVAIIDDEDWDLVKPYTWYAKKGSGRKGSIYYPWNWKIGPMHRLIMNNPKGLHVDHKNHDPMDNRKSNLRACTVRQNLCNRKKKANRKRPSKYLGVSPSLKKWQAIIGVNYKNIYLGTFPTEDEAALIYDMHAKAAFGEFANLNFKRPIYAGNI